MEQRDLGYHGCHDAAVMMSREILQGALKERGDSGTPSGRPGRAHQCTRDAHPRLGEKWGSCFPGDRSCWHKALESDIAQSQIEIRTSEMVWVLMRKLRPSLARLRHPGPCASRKLGDFDAGAAWQTRRRRKKKGRKQRIITRVYRYPAHSPHSCHPVSPTIRLLPPGSH